MITRKLLASVATALALSVTSAYAVIDPNASSILLRKSCDDGAGNTLNNCFTDETAMMNWIDGTRQPSDGDSITVDIGPGTYGRIQWLCQPGEGHVSFRGAGRGRTVFYNDFILGNAMTFQNCEKLTFDSMTMEARFISVVWAGGGDAVWTDVELIASYSTWYETPAGQLSSGGVCTTDPNNDHRFFSSTLHLRKPTLGALIYLNNCGVTWFYGSELIFDAEDSTMAGQAVGIRSSGAGHETHLYGSNIRMFAGTDSAITSLLAFRGNDGAEIHSHGTGIDVVSDKDIPITVIEANPGSHVHTAESAYVLRTGPNGTVTRIDDNGGMVHAPHDWGHVPNTDGNHATVDTNYVSKHGADRAVVQNGTSSTHPHPAIYSDSCPSTARWYDIIDKTCRSH